MWVTTWKTIRDDGRYIVCSVNARKEGGYYLANPELLEGWQVKRRMERCYAAIVCPPLPKDFKP